MPSPDSLQPNLAPVGIDGSRAHAMEVTSAHNALQDDAWVAELQHPAGPLVDDVLNPPQYPGLAPAVLEHLGVERHATVLVAGIKRGEDFLPTLDADYVSRL